MTKAVLTPPQTRAAILAGIFGHGLFVLGWYGFALILALGLFALLSLVVGKAFGSLLGGSAAGDMVRDFFGQFTGFFLVFAIVVGVICVVLILVGFVVSRAILKGGGVRRPTATTWSAFGIAAVLDIAMFWVYLGISNAFGSTKGQAAAITPVVAIVGSIAVGIGVWLWMTWGHRGNAIEPSAVEPPAAQSVLPPPPPVS